MKTTRILVLALSMMSLAVTAQSNMQQGARALWGSVNGLSNASLGDYYPQHSNKLLLSWRMLPGEDENTTFDIFYRPLTSYRLTMVTTSGPVATTNYQVSSFPTASRMYYLVEGGKYKLSLTTPSDERAQIQAEILATALDSFLVDERIWQDKLPYLSIPLQSTEDVSELVDVIRYQANDMTVGDLDGDGVMEVIVKRLLTVYDANGNITGSSEGAADTDRRARHVVIWDAYKLDGTLMWRVKSGPNIIAGNSSSVMVGDLDGDGCAEFVTKTGEGTVFGDGKEIGDTDNDGITDYRDRWNGHYTGDSSKGYGGPEYFSVIDGKTGAELARANFIARGPEGQTPAQWVANYAANSQSWGDGYWKRANSLRMGLASFTGKGLQIFLGRGVYDRTVVEGWKFENGELVRMWKFDSAADGGQDKNKDGKPNSAYKGQGNHSFNVADLDGDGRDEVMYGSCAFDDDGTGLWSTGLGHGDANHVGKFIPAREGLQVYHCLEGGKTEVAVHDAKDGSVIWDIVAATEGDQGRCMVADVDPTSPGCEFWKYGNELYSQDGKELYNSSGSRKTESSCNMAIWFDGSLNRQLINENIINSYSQGRTFTMYRYEGECAFINGSKSNPGFYGDFLGDWREEFIVPDNTKLDHINIYSTWYPSDHKFPWLMTDHTYRMQAMHENVGYNQPTNLGYYLGSDLTTDAEAWAAAAQTQDWNLDWTLRPTGIETITNNREPISNNYWYDLQGRKIENRESANRKLQRGIYIVNGKKVIR